jgi:hypothetical protein
LDDRAIEEFVLHLNRCPTVWPHAQAGHPEGCASVSPLCPVC